MIRRKRTFKPSCYRSKVVYKQCLYDLQLVKRLQTDALFVRRLVRPYYNKILTKKRSLFWHQSFTKKSARIAQLLFFFDDIKFFRCLV